AITYNIPDGFAVGSYIFTVNFTDDFGNFVTESVTFTVEDTLNPTIAYPSSNLTVEFPYTDLSISWNVVDPHPNTYTIEFHGSGIVVGPIEWESDVTVLYDIPDDLAIGTYVFTANFMDDYGHILSDSVTLTIIEDSSNPSILEAPDDVIVEILYTNQSLSWTATDFHPYTYVIDLQGSGVVVGPIAWESGIKITYNIPDNFPAGVYVYAINFTDDFGNSMVESVTFTVVDSTNPSIVNFPSDISVEISYSDQSITWNATDSNPNNYTIELLGVGIVEGPIAWESGVAITFDIPDGFEVGTYMYTINFTDDYGNSITENVIFVVSSPNDEKSLYEKEWFWGAVGAGASVVFGGIGIIKKRKKKRGKK
ncbi:MAG: hypothetical protein ACTSVZ_04865, partial [Promethearchaeota archaeon]